jgi:hypothetical protein
VSLPRPVLIRWGDSSHWGMRQVRLDAHDELVKMCRPVQMQTVGWLITESIDGYLVAQEFQDADHIPTAREMVFIPKAGAVVTDLVERTP